MYCWGGGGGVWGGEEEGVVGFSKPLKVYCSNVSYMIGGCTSSN